MEPSYLTKRKEKESLEKEVFQIWWENEECPNGTIPILRQERNKFHIKASFSHYDDDDDDNGGDDRSKHEV